MLVIGECGDGKSSLVAKLIDKNFEKGDQLLEIAKKARGVTKHINVYGGPAKGNKRILLWDTPGIGDKDITAMELLSRIEVLLGKRGQVDFGAVLVTNKIANNRVTLGAQIVQTIVDKGFCGDDKWKRIVLVGTQKDRCTLDEIETWKKGEEDSPSVVDEFYNSDKDKQGPAVAVDHSDMSPLLDVIYELVEANLGSVKYETPEADALANGFGKALGIDEAVIAEAIKAQRKEAAEGAKQAWSAKDTVEVIGALSSAAASMFGTVMQYKHYKLDKKVALAGIAAKSA